ncbi:MAG: DUF1080 domain-containing protein [Verrucomicrobia bacterium]|nr:DUF1080 domain-containing protein [Verrucomicrobiota bacterium]
MLRIRILKAPLYPALVWFFLLGLALAGRCGEPGGGRAGDAPAVVPTKTIVLYAPGMGLEAFTTWLDPHGRNNDPNRVFSVVDRIDGAPAIRVSGQHFGGLVTKEAYADCRLVFEYRWGLSTWKPRATAGKDSGVLLHCQGREGNTKPDYTSPWQHSIELMMMEGATGDIILVYGHDEKGQKLVPEITMRTGARERVWDPTGTPKRYVGGRLIWRDRDPTWKNELGFRGAKDIEGPDGQWSRVEAVCAGGDVSYFVNGVLVMEATDGTLRSGRLLFQSEGAELYFRRIELHPLRAPAAR